MGSGPWSKIEDYKIGICCFSAKHTLKSTTNAWFAPNQDNVSEWKDMSIIHAVLVQ
jgi:hypothetical protein